MTGDNTERSHAYLGSLGRNRKEKWWSGSTPRNSAALMAEASWEFLLTLTDLSGHSELFPVLSCHGGRQVPPPTTEAQGASSSLSTPLGPQGPGLEHAEPTGWPLQGPEVEEEMEGCEERWHVLGLIMAKFI